MIITRTPLRLSLLGGNTDYPAYFKKYGGVVLTTTIDKYIDCIVRERFDDMIYINYSVKEIVDKVDDIKHELVREAMRLVGIKDSIEITFLSDIPSEGSGLGSSSSVTVGLLNALHQYKNESVSARQLADEACEIEIDILKKPIGIQDQYAVAFGGLNLITMGDEILINKIQSNTEFEDSLMLFYTNKTRKSSKILSKMKLNKKILDQNKKLACLGATTINEYGIVYFGSLLNLYWNLKKKLNSYVTNTDIDKMYEKALKAGAIGGKIVGAGGGGFLLLVVKPENQNNVRRVMGRELPFKISNYGSRVIFNIQ